MNTSKPISTISYNTEEFLRKKIEYWKSIGLIEYGMWIKHAPDTDDKKEHHHVYLQPAKLIQTMFLEQDSLEIDPTWKPKGSYKDEEERENHEKRQYLKMITFRHSKEGDWLLYGIHDKTYLIEKGLERNTQYSFDDVKSTCHDTLLSIISHISDERKGRLEYRIIQCIQMGMTWQQIIASGLIPIRYMAGAKIMYEAITGQAKID